MSGKLLSRTQGVRAGHLALFFGCLMLPVVFLLSFRFTVNVTPSMPVGLYRLFPVDRPIVRGDVIQICPSPDLAKVVAERETSGLRGACFYQTVPLLKYVAALPGDVVDLRDSGVTVNGVTLPGSAAMPPRKGRPPVPHVARGRYVLKPGQLWLWTPYYRSWDSRYFGPVSTAYVRGFARAVCASGSWADWAGGMRSLASIPSASKKN